MKYSVPLIVFTCVVIFLARGLYLNPRQIPSPLINQPIPEINLPTLMDGVSRIKSSDLLGRPFLLNVFASWCAPCLEEHGLLMELADTKSVDIYGLNYKDTNLNALAWLGRNGNPYRLIAVDVNGKMGIDLGVYGVPETFFIDEKGVVRFKHVGPLTSKVINDEILTRINGK